MHRASARRYACADYEIFRCEVCQARVRCAGQVNASMPAGYLCLTCGPVQSYYMREPMDKLRGARKNDLRGFCNCVGVSV